ncbi:Uncharacterised protein [Mycobacteroides abscessus subsp. abscessus]|nr:Uncharacterised protein [Mycobacteroides abscessus subsp. abscessus]
MRDVQHLMRHLGGGKQGTCGGQSVGGASQNGLIGGVVIGHPHRRDGLDERTQHRLLAPAGDHPSGRNICLRKQTRGTSDAGLAARNQTSSPIRTGISPPALRTASAARRCS